ncbi:hypothetical protein [Vibrio campbellii]|uniref:Uncharacterized protein n=1 Tax=Vibrio campbellii (strain ATCC BAA-1116) TaxID=2902295 RepID=A7N245_VIBC1|nr:hypothetical protein [Vibrio campbellii]ABU74657.1 hypothetical protein VIBHAR_06774 [Vibrio campbellii ATCC BAA-1116]AGU98235.1 hypothetical protein M892_18655 [Vibrio campbellii ATCC BAA-1116]MBT0124602.1 hypothetical protein [Vibrio campbellii]MBT0139527.1 hypothetical protein [Vibrio campbellii]MBT0144202.1 hypothetical protein [Vibrio campbellii]
MSISTESIDRRKAREKKLKKFRKRLFSRRRHLKFFESLGQHVEDIAIEISRCRKPTRSILFLSQSSFKAELEKIFGRPIEQCSSIERRQLIDYAITLSYTAGMSFTKIAQIQNDILKKGSKQSVLQRYQAFTSELFNDDFTSPDFAKLIMDTRCSAKESIHVLTGWSGNLVQHFYTALHLCNVHVSDIEKRIRGKIAASKSDYSLDHTQYIIHLIVYLLMQRLHPSNFDKLTPELRQLVEIDYQHISENQHLADCYCIGYRRGYSYDKKMENLETVALGRLNHRQKYFFTGVAFIPSKLNSAVKTDGQNTSVIQFHDQLIRNRIAIAELLEREDKNQRQNLYAVIDVLLTHYTFIEND